VEDPVEILQGNDESLGRVLGLYDTPAYVRRGLELTESRERVFRRCEAMREDWLRWVRVHLRMLRLHIDNWCMLREYLSSDEDCCILANLAAALLNDGPTPGLRDGSAWGVRRKLRDLIECIERFNHRWTRFLAGLDLSEVNARAAAYNRYYLLEKECAMRSPRLAARGFEPAKELTHEELALRFPCLPTPKQTSRARFF